MSIQDKKNKLLAQLQALKLFPNNNQIKILRKRINQQLSNLERKTKVITTKEEINITANVIRSTKLKKYHRYIRLIRNNFPNLKYKEIQKQFSKRKQEQDVSIPDAVWQNPSP